jgi:hypothetical protein
MTTKNKSSKTGNIYSSILNHLKSLLLTGLITLSKKDKIIILRQFKEIKDLVETGLYDIKE